MQSFGEMLKEARRARDRTLEELGLATGIEGRYLEALETNQFQALPGRAFGKLYVRAYARVLGFDPQPLLEAYDRECARQQRRSSEPQPEEPSPPRRFESAIAEWRQARLAERGRPDRAGGEASPEAPVEESRPSGARTEGPRIVEATQAARDPESAPLQAARLAEKGRETVMPEEADPVPDAHGGAAPTEAAKMAEPDREAGPRLDGPQHEETRTGPPVHEPGRADAAASVPVTTGRSWSGKPIVVLLLASALLMSAAAAVYVATVGQGSARSATPTGGASGPSADHPGAPSSPPPAGRAPGTETFLAGQSTARPEAAGAVGAGVEPAVDRATRSDASLPPTGATGPGVGTELPTPPDQNPPSRRERGPSPTRTSAAPVTPGPGRMETEELTVTDSGVGRRIVARRLEGRDDTFAVGSVVLFSTRVLGGRPGDRIRHVWLFDGRAVQTIGLRLGGSDWRTHSRKTLRKAGRWEAQALDEEGRVLARAKFTCLAGSSDGDSTLPTDERR